MGFPPSVAGKYRGKELFNVESTVFRDVSGKPAVRIATFKVIGSTGSLETRHCTTSEKKRESSANKGK